MSIDAPIEFDDVCFIIGPIGSEGSETRRHANARLENIFEPAITANELKVIRADKILDSNSITLDIIKYIMLSRLVLADLWPDTEKPNPNMMYELGVRHAVGLPVVHFGSNPDIMPFDIKDMRTVYWNGGFDKIKSARLDLQSKISATLSFKGKQYNPIITSLTVLGIKHPFTDEKENTRLDATNYDHLIKEHISLMETYINFIRELSSSLSNVEDNIQKLAENNQIAVDSVGEAIDDWYYNGLSKMISGMYEMLQHMIIESHSDNRFPKIVNTVYDNIPLSALLQAPEYFSNSDFEDIDSDEDLD